MAYAIEEEEEEEEICLQCSFCRVEIKLGLHLRGTPAAL